MRFYLFSVLTILSLLTGCGRNNSKKPFTPGDSGNVPQVVFDPSVETDQREMLNDDLAYLGTLGFTSANQSDLSKLGVSDLSNATLVRFIGDRIKYIVGESYDLKTNGTTISMSGGYNPNLFSEIEEQFSKVVTVMVNTGSAAYRDGKANRKLYTLYLDGQSVQVKSPRIGVIKIGEGLFTAARVKSSALTAKVNRLLRLGTLFHESRHSDGNGSNVGFPHKMCDSGEFKGYYACENNLNGPYSIEAVLMKRFYEACYDCTETELAGLQASAADAASRLSANPTMPDATPEKIQ